MVKNVTHAVAMYTLYEHSQTCSLNCVFSEVLVLRKQTPSKTLQSKHAEAKTFMLFDWIYFREEPKIHDKQTIKLH